MLRKTSTKCTFRRHKKIQNIELGLQAIILNLKKACFRKENKPIGIVSIRLGIAITTKRQVSLTLAIINNVVIFPKLRFKEFNFDTGRLSLSLSPDLLVCAKLYTNVALIIIRAET